MTRKEKFIKFLDLVDEKIGIGLDIDYDEINDDNVDVLKAEFVEKFTVKHNFKKILLKLNENKNKSYMELLDEV